MSHYLVLLHTLEFFPARLATIPYGLDSNVTKILANLLTKPSEFYYFDNYMLYFFSITIIINIFIITDQLILQNGEKIRWYRRNNNGPKTLPCGTPETTLPVYSDRFATNCVNIDKTEPPIPTEQCLQRIP